MRFITIRFTPDCPAETRDATRAQILRLPGIRVLAPLDTGKAESAPTYSASFRGEVDMDSLIATITALPGIQSATPD